jgi:hypothetical protein
MPSPAAAGTKAGLDHDRSGNDHDGIATVRAASTIGTAMKARTAATLNPDHQVSRSLAGGKRHGLHGAARKSENKSKSDKLVHALLPGLFMRDAIIG